MGKDITDIARHFKSKDVLVFYAGSEHGYSQSTLCLIVQSDC